MKITMVRSIDLQQLRWALELLGIIYTEYRAEPGVDSAQPSHVIGQAEGHCSADLQTTNRLLAIWRLHICTKMARRGTRSLSSHTPSFVCLLEAWARM